MLTGKSTSARGIKNYNDVTETARYKCTKTVKGLGKGISTMRLFIICCDYTKMGIFGWSSHHKSLSCCRKKGLMFCLTDFQVTTLKNHKTKSIKWSPLSVNLAAMNRRSYSASAFRGTTGHRLSQSETARPALRKVGPLDQWQPPEWRTCPFRGKKDFARKPSGPCLDVDQLGQ